MTKKRARGFTPDGFIKIQRTVLRRCITDRLQALLNGDFLTRHDISDDDYDSLVNEIKGLNVAPPVAVEQPAVGGGGKDGNGASGKNGKGGTDKNGKKSTDGTPLNKPQSPPEQQPTNTFSSNLETFIQIIASSIMIDATLRGENAGESDTRFIKKKKKILIKTIQGPKLSDFIKEVERYDMIKKGIEFDEEEIVESEDSDDDSSSSEEEESDEEDMDKKMPAKKKTKYSKIAAAAAAASSKNKESSDNSEDEMSVTSKSSKSSTLTNENSTLDGFSTSQASSSANNNKLTKKEKKERKRLKKEKKRLKKEEKRKLKKERKRKEKEERKKKRKLEKQLEKKKKLAAAAGEGGGGKKSKKKRKQEEDKKLAAAAAEDEDENEEVSVDNEDDESMEDASQQEESDNEEDEGADNEDDNDDEPTIYEITTKVDFDKYKADLLSRVPKAVKSRFREGGFSRWGKDWLPVLELGPFDVEPGPVRDMWLDMFDNTQESGRDMTRLVFWYGVKYEERSQAYSFVPEAKIIPYEEGESKGYYKMPKKISNKMEKKQKLTKTEEQIKRGLAEIVSDMAKKKSERLSWMMKFKEDYELAAEEAEKEEARKKMKAAVSNEKKKKKLGRPKKDDSTTGKKKLGRPKKSDKKMGRPKKSDGKKESTAKKWVMMDDEQESDIETESDEDDNDYDDENDDSGDEGDMNVDDDDSDDSDDDVVKAANKKRKASTSTDKRKKNKRSKNMTEEERAIERKAKAAEYREKKAREKCEAQGLEYVKGRVGRKSKAVMLEEEQLKFTKCEEVFVPMMDKLTKAKEESNVKRALKCINAINEKVDILTPPFLREYPLGMLVKQVRKSFEGTHPEVKDRCKSLTAEMKRVFNEKDPKVPEGFVPVKNRKSKPKEESATPVPKAAVKTAKAVKSEKVAPKASAETPKVDRVDSSTEPCMSKQNSEMSLSGKMTPAASSDCLPDAVKSEPKQKKSFSLKGMFEKPKPAPKPKISVQAPSASVISTQPSPKPTPKALPSWVTGPATKMDDFHEQHAKERTFGLEFLVDAASLVSSTKKFDPISVSQSFELAIFAETKLRGRDWEQYWEKIHDVVAMLSPGTDKRNAILQGIIDGNYQDASELVKLSRREIQSLNQLRG